MLIPREREPDSGCLWGRQSRLAGPSGRLECPPEGTFPSRSQPQCVRVVCPTEDCAQCSSGRDKAFLDVRGNLRREQNRPRSSPKGWAPRQGCAHDPRGSRCTKPPSSRGPPDQESATLVLENQRASHVPRPPDAPFTIHLIEKSHTQPGPRGQVGGRVRRDGRPGHMQPCLCRGPPELPHKAQAARLGQGTPGRPATLRLRLGLEQRLAAGTVVPRSTVFHRGVVWGRVTSSVPRRAHRLPCAGGRLTARRRPEPCAGPPSTSTEGCGSTGRARLAQRRVSPPTSSLLGECRVYQSGPGGTRWLPREGVKETAHDNTTARGA